MICGNQPRCGSKGVVYRDAHGLQEGVQLGFWILLRGLLWERQYFMHTEGHGHF